MDDVTPRIESRSGPGGPRATLLGSWTAAQFAAQQAWQDAQRGLKAAGNGGQWDLRQLRQLDHVGGQLLWNHWGRKWPAQLEASQPQRTILERVAEYSVDAPPAAPRTWQERLLETPGTAALHGIDHLRGFVRLIGQLALNLVTLARAPHQGPWRDLSGHLYNIGATALPITALVGFLIGITLAYLTSRQLQQFGADAFIVDILGVSLIRELGPMLAAILVAGRSGSAITAQIGVMRVTDELDAMRVMGITHSFRLVMPRAMALAIAMPLVSVWTTCCALAGGMISADVSMGITPAYFLNALPQAVQLPNLTLATFKSMTFGILIALIGCHFGLRVKPNTQSLGEGTTASVVTSITMVILVDALFAILFKDVGI